MFELGGFFELPGLRQQALKSLEDQFIAPMVQTVCRHNQNSNGDAFRDEPQAYSQFRDIVLAAYGSNRAA